MAHLRHLAGRGAAAARGDADRAQVSVSDWRSDRIEVAARSADLRPLVRQWPFRDVSKTDKVSVGTVIVRR